MEEEKYKNKVLAEELAEKLDDQNNIGFYYTLASQYEHEFLRSISYWVSDYPNPQNKGALFTWRLKNLLKEKEIPDEESQSSNFDKYIEQKRKLDLSFKR